MRFLSQPLKNYKQSHSKYNFKYTTAESKVTIDICQITGLITLIRTKFGLWTTIWGTIVYTFCKVLEHFLTPKSKVLHMVRLFPTYY
jgi:hypothetical protein